LAFIYKEGDLMVTVEAKLKLFEVMVREKEMSVDRKRQKDIIESNNFAIAEVKAACFKQRKEYMEKMKKKAMADRRKLVLTAKMEVQRQVMAKKGELIEEISRKMKQRAEAFVNTEAYSAYFLQLLQKILMDFESKNDLLIGARSNDLNQITGEIPTRADDTIIGGLYVIREGKIKYDFTLDREVERMYGFLGKAVNELLQSIEEESCR